LDFARPIRQRTTCLQNFAAGILMSGQRSVIWLRWRLQLAAWQTQ
jgi:hypothetical protein